MVDKLGDVEGPPPLLVEVPFVSAGAKDVGVEVVYFVIISLVSLPGFPPGRLSVVVSSSCFLVVLGFAVSLCDMKEQLKFASNHA